MVLETACSRLKRPRNWLTMLVFAVPGPPTRRDGCTVQVLNASIIQHIRRAYKQHPPQDPGCLPHTISKRNAFVLEGSETLTMTYYYVIITLLLHYYYIIVLLLSYYLLFLYCYKHIIIFQ